MIATSNFGEVITPHVDLLNRNEQHGHGVEGGLTPHFVKISVDVIHMLCAL